MSSRALLISGDSATLQVLGQVLTEMDLTIEPCSDAGAAVRKFTAQRFEVVVIDTPEVPSAQELLHALRRSNASQNSLAICVLDVQTNVRAVFAAGANLILYRPVVPERARASIRAAGHLIRREKRRAPRLPVHADATISYPAVESAAATLVDLSEDGLAIQCERQLPAKSKIYFRFALPGQMKWIQLSGETVWQDSTGRAGIRFIDVPQTARRFLKDWLSSRSSLQESKVRVDLPVGRPGPLPSSPNDRRVESRHACQLGAEVYRSGSDVPNRCTLTDISSGGCYVETTSPFETGANVDIVIKTHDFRFKSRGVVQVVNRGFGMGVEFATQTSEQREQVQQLIKIVFVARALDADPVLRF
jgi:DNA-binding response OmpR family regulator/Tfp pilus assembly protein PilZ